MKHTHLKSMTTLASAILFSCVLSLGIASEEGIKTITDFSNPLVGTQWLSVNDGVMGGVSKGSFRITEDKTLEFSGSLSLENNGGFTSIRSRPADLNLDGYDTIAIRIKGDGRTYSLNLRTSSRNAAGSYRAPFRTKKNTWQVVRIPFKDFGYTAYGRRYAGTAPLQANKVQSVGFTLSDKQAGTFQLEVDWIRAEKASAPNETATVKQSDDSTENKDIVDTAVAAGKFKTLVAAVKAAGLVDALKAEGPLTVFAPSDEAFAKLPEGTVASLLKPENREKLIAILTYHVLPGEILLGDRSSDTLQGQALAISTNGSFEVNGANVVASDIVASNGVIHVIDTVLMPPSKTQTAREAILDVIQLAIKRGVPLFNAGQPGACAAIYEVAIESLLRSNADALSDKNRSTLRDALRDMRDDQGPREQAWTLRRALDKIQGSLS
jgi:uncharacterized surface protein with fasciclin (FAS1) repeats